VNEFRIHGEIWRSGGAGERCAEWQDERQCDECLDNGFGDKHLEQCIIPELWLFFDNFIARVILSTRDGSRDDAVEQTTGPGCYATKKELLRLGE
jgi:hypothetical protein